VSEELEKQAIIGYVFQEKDRAPVVAARWLSKLPSGSKRQDMAKRLAET
jgi:hypothetical protein